MKRREIQEKIILTKHEFLEMCMRAYVQGWYNKLEKSDVRKQEVANELWKEMFGDEE